MSSQQRSAATRTGSAESACARSRTSHFEKVYNQQEKTMRPLTAVFLVLAVLFGLFVVHLFWIPLLMAGAYCAGLATPTRRRLGGGRRSELDR